MRLSKYEMETTINWNMEEDIAYISTREPAIMAHMEKKLGIKPTKVHKDKNGKTYGKDYEIPKKWLRKPQRPRKLSEEVKQALQKRGQELSRARHPKP